MRRAAAWAMPALAVAILCAAVAVAQTGPETFKATASVKKGAASASAPVTVMVSRYASDSEIENVRKVARDGGSASLHKALAAAPDVGFIQLGERRTPIKFAAHRPTSAGRLITVLTAEPMLFLGAGIPDAKPMAGYDVAIAILDLSAGGGKGELAPAAKVGIDQGGAIVIEDYGATLMWLTDLAAARSGSSR
jgi:hypothetical protein